MLTESEILVDLRVRIPAHACYVRSGLYEGMRRYQRRQATHALRASWKAQIREWRYHEQVWRQVFFYPGDERSTKEEIVEAYGDRVFVDPFGSIHIARRDANIPFLISRGYLPGSFIDSVETEWGQCEALPWPPKSQRKLCRWQLPPKGRKFRQPGGLTADSIPAISLFPEEWRPKDAYDVEDEDDEV